MNRSIRGLPLSKDHPRGEICSTENEHFRKLSQARMFLVIWAKVSNVSRNLGQARLRSDFVPASFLREAICVLRLQQQ